MSSIIRLLNCGTCVGIYGAIAALSTILVASVIGVIGDSLRADLCQLVTMTALLSASADLLARRVWPREHRCAAPLRNK